MITVLVSVPLLMMVMPSIQNTLGSAFMVYSFFYNSLKPNPDSSTADNGLEYYARLSVDNSSTNRKNIFQRTGIQAVFMIYIV